MHPFYTTISSKIGRFNWITSIFKWPIYCLHCMPVLFNACSAYNFLNGLMSNYLSATLRRLIGWFRAIFISSTFARKCCACISCFYWLWISIWILWILFRYLTKFFRWCINTFSICIIYFYFPTTLLSSFFCSIAILICLASANHNTY